jgi:hypothetical protein
MNRCGSGKSRIRIQTAVVMFLMANIGIVKAKVTGRDVRTYFSNMDVFYYDVICHIHTCSAENLGRIRRTIAVIRSHECPCSRLRCL